MQQRIEPHVGASRPSIATLNSAWVDAHSAPPRDDYRTEHLPDESLENTVDIPFDDLPVSGDAQAAEITRAIAADEAVERDVSIGTILRDRYVLHRLIGTGGTCRVFLAEDMHRRLSPESSGELVALKVLRPGLRHAAHSLQRLRREFLQMQQLNHGSIARVYDLDCDGDVWFMTMEMIDASNALTWMSGTYSNAEALRVILACCEAIAYAHRKGIVHGDVKPGNVLVTADGNVKLIDFGSVVSADEPEDSPTKLEATPQYASPAVLSGNMAEVRDDVFGLGCLAYMILSRGRHPFERKSSLEAERTRLRPTYIAGVPLRLFEVVVRALAWDPDQRQATVRELQHALINAELSRPTLGPPSKEPASRAPEPAAAANEQAVQEPEPAEEVPPPTAPPEPPSDPRNYLSRFRGYVAGPMMDTKLHGVAHAPQERREPLPPIVPITPRANDLIYAESRLPPERRTVSQPRRAMPSRLAAVNAFGIMLVMAAAITAAVLSGQGQAPRPSKLSALPPKIAIPILTIPTPNMEPVPMPTVLIANSRETKAPTPRRTPPAAKVASANGVVSFESRSVAVSPTQGLVAIPIRRSDANNGPVRVAWEVGERGRQLLDERRTGSQVIQFHRGQTTRTLYLPLRKDAADLAAEGSRTFAVKLQKVDDGPAPGRVAEVRVTLLER